MIPAAGALLCVGLAFHPDDLSYAEQNRRDVTWYRNIQTAPITGATWTWWR